MATVDERNARLDALQTAVTNWAGKQRTELRNTTTLLRRLLSGRTGSDRLASKTVLTVSDLVVDEIDQFLSGDL